MPERNKSLASGYSEVFSAIHYKSMGKIRNGGSNFADLKREQTCERI